MIKTAVILAAGMGARFRGYNGDKPKGFIEIDNQCIIKMSIKKLIENGIEKIIIGTGFSNEYYENLKNEFPQILCKKNENYISTTSMGTLYCLKSLINEPFILIESDIIYDKKAIKKLVHNDNENIIISSQISNSKDEVFIEVDEDSNLVKLSKNKNELNQIHSELTGINKVSYDAFLKMCECYEKNTNLDYEKCLEHISNECKIKVLKINDLIWSEIDTVEHLNKVKDIIYPKLKIIECNSKIKKNTLLNPGPATTTDTVKYSQVVPDICPREKEFGQIMEFISKELTLFVGSLDEYTAVLFGGSGTSAIEATISSVVPYNKKIIIINNGAYGKRIVEICKVHNIDHIEFKSSMIESINLEELKTVIESNKNISHLSVIHNETTSGLLNDINKIGKLCGDFNVSMIVDAMSSYGAIPINMKNDNISYLISSSNKNVQGMAGVSFVICNKEELNKTKSIKPRCFYLSLYDQYEYFIKNYQMRFTPPVQTLYALKQAIIELKDETIEKRYTRYSKSWNALITGLKKIGLKTLVDEKNHSKIITTIVEPNLNNYNFDEMHDFLIKEGFTIYPGKIGDLNTFRIANIGNIDENDINELITLLKKYFNILNSGTIL